jgi:outer membrane protein OmpA-like peptidoglycan-associated protein
METTDPYATGKANLRDTIKWLATTVAGLAALLLGATPFSGIGTLAFGSERFIIALTALAGGAGLLMIVWTTLVHLLRSDVVFPSQLRSGYSPQTLGDSTEQREIQALREHLNAQAVDLFPTTPPTFDGLESLRENAWQTWQQSASPGDLEAWKAYDANANLVLNYAAFARLHRRLTRAIPTIGILTGLALLCLFAYAWAANPSKETPAERLLVLQPLPTTPTVSAPSLAPVRFLPGKWDLDKQALTAITSVSDFLRRQPETGVLLLAHTDTQGGATINSRVVRGRWNAVRNILVTQGGIPPSRVFVSELPKTALPVITLQEVPDAENRSLEFVIVQLPKQ